MAKTPEKKFSARALKSWETRRKNAKKAKKLEAAPQRTSWDDPTLIHNPPHVGPTADELLEAVRSEKNASPGTESAAHTSTFETNGWGKWSTGSRSFDLLQIADEIKAMDRTQAAGKLHYMVSRITADQEIIARRRAADQYKDQYKAIDERIVCAWLAEVDEAMKAGNGGLRMDEVWILNSLLVTKIVDALNAAGYTAKGRRRT